MGTHAQQDFMKFLYFQKKKLWYNIANGAYYTAPICSERTARKSPLQMVRIPRRGHSKAMASYRYILFAGKDLTL